MTRSGLAMGALAVAAMAACAGTGRAEDWLDTRHTTLIDGDSIRTESDGLTYFMERQKYPDDPDNPDQPMRAAVDCVNRVWYSSYSIAYEADWRAKGQKAIAGTMGGELLDFVCSRVR